MYEYFVVCGARTDNHIQSIPQALSELHLQECGFKCVVEGANGLDGWSCAGKVTFFKYLDRLSIMASFQNQKATKGLVISKNTGVFSTTKSGPLIYSKFYSRNKCYENLSESRTIIAFVQKMKLTAVGTPNKGIFPYLTSNRQNGK